MNSEVRIPEEACEFKFVHASGPGGQHVNKTATAVELRVDIDKLALNHETRSRLRLQQRNRINKQGQLVIQADEFRSQLKNRKAAVTRLQEMIAAARVRPKKRIATKPTAASKKRRMADKKQRGQTKANRRKPTWD